MNWLLREADRGEKSIQAICRDENLSVVSFHRWKKQFGHMENPDGQRRTVKETAAGAVMGML
jgi:hypothetical protein